MSFKGNKNNKRSRSEKKAFGSDFKKSGTVKSRDKGKYIDFKEKKKKGDPLPSFREDAIRLNKFLSNAGVCSRREADRLIEIGSVTINSVVATLGDKATTRDTIKVDGTRINTTDNKKKDLFSL